MIPRQESSINTSDWQILMPLEVLAQVAPRSGGQDLWEGVFTYQQIMSTCANYFKMLINWQNSKCLDRVGCGAPFRGPGEIIRVQEVALTNIVSCGWSLRGVGWNQLWGQWYSWWFLLWLLWTTFGVTAPQIYCTMWKVVCPGMQRKYITVTCTKAMVLQTLTLTHFDFNNAWKF